MSGEGEGLSEDVVEERDEEEDEEGELTSAASSTSCVIVRKPSASVAGGSPAVACMRYRGQSLEHGSVERKESKLHLSGYRVLRQCKVSFDNMRREPVFRQFKMSNEANIRHPRVFERSLNA